MTDERKLPPAPVNGEVAFAVGRSQLLKALRSVSKVVRTRTTLPVTALVRVEAAGGTFPEIVISGTDLDAWLQLRLEATVSKPGVLLLPPRRLMEMLRASDAETVSLALPAKSRELRVDAGELAATLTVIDAEDFPNRPGTPGGGLTFDRALLVRALNRVLTSAATDDSRPVLTSVYMRFEEHAVTFCTADGFRLTEAKVCGPSWISWPGPDAAGLAINMPAQPLAVLLQLLGQPSAHRTVQLAWNGTEAVWRAGDAELLVQLVQGTFPNYGQLIPKRWLTRVTVPAEGFRRAVAMVDTIAREGSGIVRLDFEEHRLRLRTKAEELGQAEVALLALTEDVATPSDREGPPRIAFNCRYLRDVLRYMEGDVVLSIEEASKQGVFRSSVDDGVTAIVMPMFVQW